MNYNISWTDDTTHLRYKQYSHYEFMPELSVESDERLVTSLNMPFHALRYSLPAAYYSILSAAYKQLPQQQTPPHAAYDDVDILFVKRSVRELMFGYEDPILLELSHIFTTIATFYPGMYICAHTCTRVYMCARIHTQHHQHTYAHTHTHTHAYTRHHHPPQPVPCNTRIDYVTCYSCVCMYVGACCTG